MSFMGEPIVAAECEPEETAESERGIRRLGLLAYSFAGLCMAVFGIDSYVTAQAMYADPDAYPVRLLIPDPISQKTASSVLSAGNASAMASETVNTSTSASDADGGDFDRGAFDRAFGGLATQILSPVTRQPAPKARSIPQPPTDKNGMLAIDFDLQGGAQSSRSIAVQKPVTVAGLASGNLSVRIDGAAKIYANRAEIASLLDGKSNKSERVRAASAEDFLSFQQIRDLGIDIRYDPSSDRIIIPVEG